MSEATRPSAEPSGTGTASARAQYWRRPPAWLWGALVLAQVGCAAALTSYTFFFVDDFLFLEQARTQRFNLAYLRENLFEHFSPISRLLDKLLVTLAPGSFVLAHAVELAMYASALIAFVLVVRSILGNGWSAFTLTVVFGQSIFLLRLLNWWTATANILPSSIFMLLSLACYLRWREVGSRKLLAASLAAYALSLLDYETAILWPAYLAAITLLVLEPRIGLRGWLATLSRERWAWAGYLVLDAAAIVNYYEYYYHPVARPSLSAVGRYLEIALVQTFVPALVGIKYPVAPGSHTFAIVAAAIVVGAAIAVTLYLRPRAWRCLAAFILVFLLTMLPVALTRIREFGVGIGHVIYYQQSLQFMFLVLLAFAISSRWSGRRALSALGGTGSAATGRRLSAVLRPSTPTLAAVGAAALAAYAALYLTSLRAMANAAWQPRQDSAYVREYLAGDRRVRAKIGREPVLIDLKVPTRVLPKKLWPYTTYGEFLALFNPKLRVDEITSPAYVLSRPGRLLPVRFASSTRGLIAQATLAPPGVSGGGATAGHSGSMACVPAAQSKTWLRVPLAQPEQMSAQASGLPDALRVRFQMPASSQVVVKLLAKRAGRGFATVTHEWYRGSGGELIPLGFTGQLRYLDFRLPAGACVTGLAFGSLQFVQSG